MKAPPTSILDFILSDKVILVEGAAEYILLEEFFKKTMGHSAKSVGVQILSVGGTSFKRYLEVSEQLSIKVAVIRDNDGSIEVNCTERYQEYINDTTQVFTDSNEVNRTFEISLYNLNKTKLDTLFRTHTSGALNYMLSSKADAAFEVLTSGIDDLNIPDYITRSIQWLSE